MSAAPHVTVAVAEPEAAAASGDGVSVTWHRGGLVNGGGAEPSSAASGGAALPGTAPAPATGAVNHSASHHVGSGAGGAGAGAGDGAGAIGQRVAAPATALGAEAMATPGSHAAVPHSSTLGHKPSTASMRALTRGLTDGQKLRIRAAFDTFDNDGTGFITAKDLRPLLQYLGDHPSSKELQELIILVDADGNGVIDFQEFMTLVVMRSRHAHTEAQVVEAFQMFDEHGTGTVPVARIRHALRHLIGMRDAQIELMVKEAVAVSGDPEHIHYRTFVRHLMRDF